MLVILSFVSFDASFIFIPVKCQLLFSHSKMHSCIIETSF